MEDWRIVMRDLLDAITGKRAYFEEVEARGECLKRGDREKNG